MTTWLWPLSWYQRIRALEAENQALYERVNRLANELRVAAMAQTSLGALYVSSLSGLASWYEAGFDRRVRMQNEAVAQQVEIYEAHIGRSP